ncbi:protein-tyrosine sulfotransferase 2 isoform X2 [Melospiza georgiana]|uniref:protein-tyrosine sulfotransferase 2 isoform X2 n=1 Tax=Melospiza georgiana TaxID=44398 RepID=UPI0025ABF032|nr:protein-tyrosine sulfotransferase 2 isoform X2 [Melospiza georgiana]XP_057892879.1 protein-tyrosine sulfotransferase 2 isoform X2 [Melospiza georgiana]
MLGVGCPGQDARCGVLSAGCSVLHAQDRMLGAGCSVQDARCWVPRQDARCGVPSAGCSVLDAQDRMLGAGCSVQDARCWVLSAGCSVLDAQDRMLGAGCPGQDARCWVPRTGCSVLGAQDRMLGAGYSVQDAQCSVQTVVLGAGCSAQCRVAEVPTGCSVHRTQCRMHSRWDRVLSAGFSSYLCPPILLFGTRCPLPPPVAPLWQPSTKLCPHNLSTAIHRGTHGLGLSICPGVQSSARVGTAHLYQDERGGLGRVGAQWEAAPAGLGEHQPLLRLERCWQHRGRGGCGMRVPWQGCRWASEQLRWHLGAHTKHWRSPGSAHLLLCPVWQGCDIHALSSSSSLGLMAGVAGTGASSMSWAALLGRQGMVCITEAFALSLSVFVCVLRLCPKVISQLETPSDASPCQALLAAWTRFQEESPPSAQPCCSLLLRHRATVFWWPRVQHEAQLEAP